MYSGGHVNKNSEIFQSKDVIPRAKPIISRGFFEERQLLRPVIESSHLPGVYMVFRFLNEYL